MAVILVLMCGGMGFTSAMAALLFFDASLIQAFALWMLGGFSAMTLVVLPVLLPPRPQQDVQKTETA